ncbi:hypothetical protein [Natrinema thermotolerans]|uniref:hypothetical protein n=1 Tax=Natrinema thermotolerans TaxID=121872 RepID=UPI000ABC14D6|nr:hypothetical protein [Natrinema thermotolerans]
MTDGPNITEVDENYDPKSDSAVEVNDIVPGTGGGSGATKLSDLENVDVTGWLEGTFADRPATDDVPVGVRYWATDRQLGYRNTENGWDVNSGTGTASNPLPEQHVQSFSTEEQSTGYDIRLSKGGDLWSRISTALSNGYSRIYVADPESGSWTWPSSVTIDPTNYDGVEIAIADSATIDVSASGWILTVDSNADLGGQLAGQLFALHGGQWMISSNPTGFARFKDIYRPTFIPHYVEGVTNGNGDAVGVSLENHSYWCESWCIGGQWQDVDIGLDFKPASVTGGSGTDSFDDGETQRPVFNGVNAIGIRFRGGVRFGDLRNISVFPNDGATAYQFAGDMRGTVLSAPKTDGTNSTGATAYQVTTDLTNPPVITGGLETTDNLIQHDLALGIPRIRGRDASEGEGGTVILEDIGRSKMRLNRFGGIELSGQDGTKLVETDSNGAFKTVGPFATGSPQVFNDGVRIDNNSTDLSTLSPTRNDVRTSDGTNLTAGPAWFDGTMWHSLVDGSTYSP